MKTFLFLVATLVALSSTSLQAQDLVGTWQGAITLPNGKELRLVVKIPKVDAPPQKGTFYSIDQGGAAIPINAITLQGKEVKMIIPLIGGSYEGKLEPDNETITGNWKQGPQPMALVIKRVKPEAAWEIPEPPPPPKPMAATEVPEFEVATIKPSKPEQQGKGIFFRDRRFATINSTLNDLITFGYGIHVKQISGGQAWMDSEKFDIIAQPKDEGQPNEKQLKTMIQKLLADRFKLTFHREKKELAVYAVAIAKGGSKLNKSEGAPNGLPALFFRGLGGLIVKNANIGDFASLMQTTVLDRPVVDQTGLTGRWDFTLDWTPDEFQFAGMGVKMPPPPNSGETKPDLFTAIQEQIGLKLESTKAPVETFIIDSVSKPTDN